MSNGNRIPVIGGTLKMPMVDRNRNPIFVGDRIRFKYIDRKEGRTGIAEAVVTEAVYPYEAIGDGATRADFAYDFIADELVGEWNAERDSESTWVEIVG